MPSQRTRRHHQGIPARRSRSNATALFLCLSSIAIACTLSGCRFLPSHQSSVVPAPLPHVEFLTPANVLVSQYYQQLKPRRIVIVTPVSRSHPLPEQHNFAKALADSLRGSGFSDAVLAPSCDCDTLEIRKGKFDLQQLVDLSADYSADAVLYCDVVSFSAYSPLQISVSMTLVDARESIAIMAIDGNWDLRDLETQNAYLNYLSQDPVDTEFQRGIKFQSPSEFMDFVSIDLANFMSEQ